MRAIIQRVTRARVSVEGEVVGAIGPGLVVFAGVTHADTPAEAELLARKIAGLRIFGDEDGKMNCSALEVGASLLVISQFTLYANVRRGRRPDFTAAARPEQARPLFEHLVRALERAGVTQLAQGVFGAMMQVTLCNDGPVTLMLDTDELSARR
jgi:D-tyrosyl-tRNA(Tyr) deacylase